jgi:mannose-1-phosphate guanylyltransferase
MNILLLAAGLGTRLKPVTDTIPKCLVPINGKPLLEIWLDNLSQIHFKKIYINTHYFSELVEKFILESRFHNRVELLFEKKLLGTGGTIRENYLNLKQENLMLIHADNYCFTNFQDFIEAHQNKPSNCAMTMMTFKTSDPKSCGILEINSNKIVVNFEEKPQFPKGNLANGAVYLLNPEVLDWIYKNNIKDFSNDVIPKYINKIYTYENTGVHIDIGTPETYKYVQTISHK